MEFQRAKDEDEPLLGADGDGDIGFADSEGAGSGERPGEVSVDDSLAGTVLKQGVPPRRPAARAIGYLVDSRDEALAGNAVQQRCSRGERDGLRVAGHHLIEKSDRAQNLGFGLACLCSARH